MLDLPRRSTALSLPVLLAAALLSVPAAGPAAATAANTPGWHIVKIFGSRGGSSAMMSVDAVSPADLWLTGEVSANTGPPGLTVEHWNGRRWRVLAVPSAEAGEASLVVAASSATNGWIFAENQQGITDYAEGMRWNGSRWSSAVRFPGWSAVYAAAVFGRASAWAFGAFFGGKRRPLRGAL